MKVVKSLIAMLYLGKGLASAFSSSVSGAVPTAINTATVSFGGKFKTTPKAFNMIWSSDRDGGGMSELKSIQEIDALQAFRMSFDFY